MKKCHSFLKVIVFAVTSFATVNMQGAVQPITGGQFDPPLVPTTNLAEIANSSIANRYIVDDATLTGIDINGIRYTDVEGPTNAVTADTTPDLYRPFNGVMPTSTQEALTNLTLSTIYNGGTYTLMFAGTVHAGAEEGFFIVENDGNDTIQIYPLGSDGERIGSWMLQIGSGDWGSGDFLRPHGRHMSMRKTGSTSVHRYEFNGLAFTLADFTGGTGILDNVQGLEITNTGLDLMMAGIYRGPGVSILGLAGRPFRMPSATFSTVYTNSSGYITNEYELVSIGCAESIAAPTNAYSFDSRGSGNLLYPLGATPPSSTDEALLGFGISGVRDIGYRDIMFAVPVTNANDGFFIIEESYYSNAHFVYPLDANRRPISTYAIAALPSSSAW